VYVQAAAVGGIEPRTAVRSLQRLEQARHLAWKRAVAMNTKLVAIVLIVALAVAGIGTGVAVLLS
jgi:hypothetical protein